MKLSFVLGIKEDSRRCKNKNLREFGDTTLTALKLNTLSFVNHGSIPIYVFTESDRVEEYIKELGLGVNVIRRDKYYASSVCTGSEFFRNLADNVDSDDVIYTPVTSPFISPSDYESLIREYYNNNLEYDSVSFVKNVKEFLWMDNKPLNYDPIDAPNSQDLPNVYSITFGGCILSRKLMYERGNVVGYNPMFIQLNRMKSVDIDTELDFEFAEFLYKKYIKWVE